jgi:hypothetical protein
MKTKVVFGRKGREKTKKAERRLTTMERLKRIARRSWPGQQLSKRGQGTPRGIRGTKPNKSRSLPERRR